MTVIRPAGSVSSLDGLQPTDGVDAVATKHVTDPKSVGRTEAVISDLRAGRLKPDEAVRQLTEVAIRNAGTPEALRPAVEARIRAALGRDPLAGALLRRMGVAVSEE